MLNEEGHDLKQIMSRLQRAVKRFQDMVMERTMSNRRLRSYRATEAQVTISKMDLTIDFRGFFYAKDNWQEKYEQCRQRLQTRF